jgi:hypothetical protein
MHATTRLAPKTIETTTNHTHETCTQSNMYSLTNCMNPQFKTYIKQNLGPIQHPPPMPLVCSKNLENAKAVRLLTLVLPKS